MRKKIIAANWKMNLTKSQALELAVKSNFTAEKYDNSEVYLFVPAVFFDALIHQNLRNCFLGAQNFYPASAGAFTGEISINHLLDFQISAVLVGHSERRILFGENDVFLKSKVDVALKAGLRVFFCCGEPEEVRNQNLQNDFVSKQLQSSLFHLEAEQIENVVIAYEPVWAIGTGYSATKEQANEMHIFIRSLLAKKYGALLAEKIRILYGGSCNAANAKELFSMSDIDGGLIGGASLKSAEFTEIINSVS
jgi:triosephosphate isomerase